jgi:hypothetical protein
MRCSGLAAAFVSALALCAGARGAAPKAKSPAWGPADVCAIAARPEWPGRDVPGEPGEAREPGDAEKALLADARTDWEFAGWDPKWKARPEWGPCPIGGVGFDELYFTSDGRIAKTVGGWRAGPIEGAWGYCLFEKRQKAWRPLGCTITAIS